MKATAIAGVSLALGLLFNYLFFEKVPGISIVIFVAAIVAGLLGLAKYFQRTLPLPALWLLAPIGFFASMLAVRASELLGFLNVLASLALLLLVARLTFRDDLKRFSLLDYARLPFLPLRFIAPLFRTLGEFFALRSAARNSGLALPIFRGVLLALPALVIFLILFSSADLVFQRYVAGAFELHISSVTVARTILVTIVTLLFIGAYSYIFPKAEPAPADLPAPPTFAIGKLEISILLGSVGALFLLFLIVQLAYLFAGSGNLSGLGFTYAEYARKGFFELLAVAVIAFGMLYLSDKFVAKPARGHSRMFQALSGLLIAEAIVIMASAFKRLYLYEQAFGFTTLRLYSQVFVIFLAVIFVLLLIKILRNQPENRFAFPAFVVAIAFLVAMNLLNPDAFIARQNLDRFYQTGKLDAEYIGQLSDDAYSEKIKAAGVASAASKDKLIDALNRRSVPSDWQSWNLARTRSY